MLSRLIILLTGAMLVANAAVVEERIVGCDFEGGFIAALSLVCGPRPNGLAGTAVYECQPNGSLVEIIDCGSDSCNTNTATCS
ncbi:hypothetical protein K438DRAFT_1972117 [Mycena galopus ATCC 62051]|nr:hypothetical protein K438DRAFT_1972117 [Mycena galopus ATCC 62051]